MKWKTSLLQASASDQNCEDQIELVETHWAKLMTRTQRGFILKGKGENQKYQRWKASRKRMEHIRRPPVSLVLPFSPRIRVGRWYWYVLSRQVCRALKFFCTRCMLNSRTCIIFYAVRKASGPIYFCSNPPASRYLHVIPAQRICCTQTIYLCCTPHNPVMACPAMNLVSNSDCSITSTWKTRSHDFELVPHLLRQILVDLSDHPLAFMIWMEILILTLYIQSNDLHDIRLGHVSGRKGSLVSTTFWM